MNKSQLEAFIKGLKYSLDIIKVTDKENAENLIKGMIETLSKEEE